MLFRIRRRLIVEDIIEVEGADFFDASQNAMVGRGLLTFGKRRLANGHYITQATNADFKLPPVGVVTHNVQGVQTTEEHFRMAAVMENLP